MSEQQLFDQLCDQEDRLVFDHFSNQMAFDLGQKLLSVGLERKLAIAIDITRSGQCLFHAALDGATPDNAEWIQRKMRVVQRFQHSSLYMGVLCRLQGTTLEEKFLVPEHTYAAHGGAFPIRLRNTGVVGSVTVSGLPQLEDHALVVEVLESLL
ncbi:MAG: heme-degrading domain-containing protein [Thalassovita sp.]